MPLAFLEVLFQKIPIFNAKIYFEDKICSQVRKDLIFQLSVSNNVGLILKILDICLFQSYVVIIFYVTGLHYRSIFSCIISTDWLLSLFSSCLRFSGHFRSPGTFETLIILQFNSLAMRHSLCPLKRFGPLIILNFPPFRAQNRHALKTRLYSTEKKKM